MKNTHKTDKQSNVNQKQASAQAKAEMAELVERIVARDYPAPVPSAATSGNARTYRTIKLGVDVHLQRYVVVRQIDGGAPQPPQHFTPTQFVEWAKKQTELASHVYSCYEAGPFGYSLHRKLTALGINNYVVRPRNWDEYGKKVKTDKRDAKELVLNLDRYVAGNQEAFCAVRVPSELEEQARSRSRQRESLQTVSSGNYSATYSYLANSPLVEQITFNDTTTRMMTVKQYDKLNRLTSIISTPTGANQPAESFGYPHNAANQRTRAELADGQYWEYVYDQLGQVVSAKKHWADASLVPGQQFEYQFDDIGNRQETKEGGDESGSGLRPASYTVNSLNQYSQRTVPGAVDVIGMADPDAAEQVNGQAAYRRGEYFQKAVTVENGDNPVYQAVNVTAGTANSAGHIIIMIIMKKADAVGRLITEACVLNYNIMKRNILNMVIIVVACVMPACTTLKTDPIEKQISSLRGFLIFGSPDDDIIDVTNCPWEVRQLLHHTVIATHNGGTAGNKYDNIYRSLVESLSNISTNTIAECMRVSNKNKSGYKYIYNLSYNLAVANRILNNKQPNEQRIKSYEFNYYMFINAFRECRTWYQIAGILEAYCRYYDMAPCIVSAKLDNSSNECILRFEKPSLSVGFPGVGIYSSSSIDTPFAKDDILLLLKIEAVKQCYKIHRAKLDNIIIGQPNSILDTWPWN